ncbi:MAG: SurA N-terminal domain-containing protein [Desulfovibrio sp.]|jgi:hypothetical protein|nr:SurA N-terminal domain-containing protein [Desulfovibrio sp.]
MRHGIVVRILVFLCLLLGGCMDRGLPEGVIATVNGEPVYLRTLQSMIDGESSSLGIQVELSLPEMQKQYANALRLLIIQMLVRQELKTLGMPITEENIQNAVDIIRNDYGEKEFAKYLADESISENEWKKLIADDLALSRFEKRVIIPRIRVTLPMVRSYYETNAEQFNMPEIYNVCLTNGYKKSDVQDYINSFPDDVNGKDESVIAACFESTKADLPRGWEKELSTIAQGKCGSIKKSDRMWQTICIKSMAPSGRMSIVKAYPIIESIIIEQKKEAAFDEWLGKKLEKSKVKISPLLMMKTPVETEKNASSGKQSPIAQKLAPQNDDAGQTTPGAEPAPQAVNGGQTASGAESASQKKNDAQAVPGAEPAPQKGDGVQPAPGAEPATQKKGNGAQVPPGAAPASQKGNGAQTAPAAAPAPQKGNGAQTAPGGEQEPQKEIGGRRMRAPDAAPAPTNGARTP